MRNTSLAFENLAQNASGTHAYNLEFQTPTEMCMKII